MIQALKNFWFEEDGQDMVEYSLLLAFIALAGISTFSAIKGDISKIWTNVKTQLNTASK
jgi:Flp pilus assembly pilin Flp